MRVRRNAYAGRLWWPGGRAGVRGRGRQPDSAAPAGGGTAVGLRSGTSSSCAASSSRSGSTTPITPVRNAHGALAATRVVPAGKRPRAGHPRRARRRPARRRTRTRQRARRTQGGAVARHGARGGRAVDNGGQGRLPGLGPRPHPGCQRPERHAAGDPGARGVRAARRAAPSPSHARGRRDRALRAADRRGPVDPARRGDGRRRAIRRARRAPVAALVRPAARGCAHADGSIRARRESRGGSCPSRRSRRFSPARRRCAPLWSAGCQAPWPKRQRSRSPRRSGRRR